MRTVAIFVDNKRVDLFKDEKITVKSSAQDVNDISKVFTDHSQTFTLPASEANNEIFGFYYNNDLNTFNANIRVDCRIEIDTVPFRSGKLQLEGSTLLNGQVDSYKVAFFGDVVSLKDKFGDDKLRDIDYSSLAFEYTGANVQASIEDSTYQDVRFPLISSERPWEYETVGGSINDISDFNNPLVYTELFPAISDSKIMDLISSNYGVTFEGNFLTDNRFKNSYTWWKNRATTENFNGKLPLEFNTGGSIINSDIPNAIGISTVNIQYISNGSLPALPSGTVYTFGYHTVKVNLMPVSVGTYSVEVFKNGTLHTTFTGSGSAVFDVDATNNIIGLDDTYTFAVTAPANFNFDYSLVYSYKASTLVTATFVYGLEQFDASVLELNKTIPNELDFSSLAPDIKVSDWLSGTLKEFNLTCYPTAPLTYLIEPLNTWYSGGDRIDISEYVDTKSIKVDRVKLYEEISFEWSKSKAFHNYGYESANGKKYGDLKASFPNNNGGKYSIKLPFETMLFNNFDTLHNNLQVSYSFDKDNKPYIPKAVKLYLNDLLTCAFYLDNGSISAPITDYMPFGQSTNDNSAKYSMNFGSEFDSLTNTNVPNSLYKTYYEQYLTNVFNPKSRQVTLKCVLPTELLTKITLDDSLIIRDKKYLINSINTDLTTGNASLVLVSDWSIEQDNQYVYFSVPQEGGIVVNGVTPPNGGHVVINDPIEAKFLTSSPTIPATITPFSSTNLTITLPVNNSGVVRFQTIVITGYRSDSSVQWIRTLVIEQAANSSFLLVGATGFGSGGYMLQENLDKIIL